MPAPYHKDLDTVDLHKPFRVQDADPGAIGAGRGWFSRATGLIKIRNAADDDWDTATSETRKGGAAYIIDGHGVVIVVGEKPGFVRVPWDGFIVGWDLYGNGGSGSIVIDSWIDTYANFPATVADTIWGGSKPTISATTKNQATGLMIAVSEGQHIRHKVDSITTFIEATLNYHFLKS